MNVLMCLFIFPLSGAQRGVRAAAVAGGGRHGDVRGPGAGAVRAPGNGGGAAVALRGHGQSPRGRNACMCAYVWGGVV